MDSDVYRKIHKVSESVLDLEIPSLQVRNYPIFRNGGESDAEFNHRVNGYAEELIRRFYSGESYTIGYRVQKDEKMHMVIRRRLYSNKIILQKILGIDEDFKEIQQDA